MNSRVFQLLAVLVVVVICVSGAMAAAASGPHSHIALKPNHSAAVHGNYGPAPTANLYGVAAFFAAESLNQPGNAWSGPYPALSTSIAYPNDLWPCFGGDTAQPDCLYIGYGAGTVENEPSLPAEVVIGDPNYTWYLTANTATSQPYGCNATTVAETYHMCTQATNFYEDDSNDTTDDLLFSIEVTQGTSIVYASGTQDYGTNPYGGLDPAGTIVFYEDMVFGIPNGGTANPDGPCFASYNYPSNTAGPGANYQGLANTFEGYFGVEGPSAGKAATVTCVAPVAGAATVTIITELAEPTWKPVKVLADCPASTMDGPPNSSSPYCYTVSYKAKHTLTQKFNVWFR